MTSSMFRGLRVRSLFQLSLGAIAAISLVLTGFGTPSATAPTCSVPAVAGLVVITCLPVDGIGPHRSE
jgi:hypothetical protein